MAGPDLFETLPPTPPGPPPPAVLGARLAAFFGALAALRGGRALHPRGLTFLADLSVPADDARRAAWRALDGGSAVVRLSRGAGLPPPLPDVLGIAVRPGGQDLLFSSSNRRGLRPLPLPARGYRRRCFSSLFPHAVGAVRAILLAVSGDDSRIRMEAVADAGRRVPLGTLTLRRTVDRRVRFDPWRAGAGLAPVGLLQRLRVPAYAAGRWAA